MFAAHLALSGLAHTSIKVYFSSIGNLHSSCSQHDAYHKALTPRLEQVLRGIKREQASTRTERIHLLITAEIMQQIFSVLSRPPSEYQNIMLWAACCTTFFGFLCIGEMTIPSSDAFNSAIHLSLCDIALDSRTTPTIIWVTIKQLKTDPFRKGVRLCLGRIKSGVCPIKAKLPYLAIRGSAPGALFISESGAPLTRAQFKTLLSATLQKAGLDDSKYIFGSGLLLPQKPWEFLMYIFNCWDGGEVPLTWAISRHPLIFSHNYQSSWYPLLEAQYNILPHRQGKEHEHTCMVNDTPTLAAHIITCCYTYMHACL